MHFELEPDLADLQSRLLSFVTNEIDPITVGVDPESPPAELRRDIAGRSDRAGYYQLVVPESDGGLGGGPRVITAAREALALSGNPLASLVLGSGPGIMRLADNEEQRATLYEPVLRGEKTAAFAFTEALRTDGSREPTQAVRAGLGNGADGFLVSGAKGFVTGGASSDWLVVVANVPDEGTALLVVDRDADGVSQGDLGASMDGSTHSPFYFDSVACTRIPAARPGWRRITPGDAEHRSDAPGSRRRLRRLGPLGDTRDAGAHRRTPPQRPTARGAATGPGNLCRHGGRHIRGENVALPGGRGSRDRPAHRGHAGGGSQVAGVGVPASHRRSGNPTPRSPGIASRSRVGTPLSNQPFPEDRRGSDRTAAPDGRAAHSSEWDRSSLGTIVVPVETGT